MAQYIERALILLARLLSSPPEQYKASFDRNGRTDEGTDGLVNLLRAPPPLPPPSPAPPLLLLFSHSVLHCSSVRAQILNNPIQQKHERNTRNGPTTEEQTGQQFLGRRKNVEQT